MSDIGHALKAYSAEDLDRTCMPHDIPTMVRTLSSRECQQTILVSAQRAARGFAGLAKTLRQDATPYRKKIRAALQHLVVYPELDDNHACLGWTGDLFFIGSIDLSASSNHEMTSRLFKWNERVWDQFDLYLTSLDQLEAHFTRVAQLLLSGFTFDSQLAHHLVVSRKRAATSLMAMIDHVILVLRVWWIVAS